MAIHRLQRRNDAPRHYHPCPIQSDHFKAVVQGQTCIRQNVFNFIALSVCGPSLFKVVRLHLHRAKANCCFLIC